MSNIFKNYFVVLFSLFFMISYSQTSKILKADKEYGNFAYVDARQIYEKLIESGKKNSDILKKLGDSYYFNGQYVQANKWYKELFDGNYIDKGKSIIDSEYYYRYSQTLKAIGDYEQAELVMLRFAEIESKDSRVIKFLSNKEYLDKIPNMEDRYEIVNSVINTPYSDYGGTFLNDKFIFTSARLTPIQPSNMIHDWTNESYTSLFSSFVNLNGRFEEPVLFSKELDSQGNDASPVFTNDGKTVYFTRNNAKYNGKQRVNKNRTSVTKVYKATLLDGNIWGNIEELPFNSDYYNTANPALSPDDNWLYFASDREGGYGQSDIYRVGLYANGGYGTPENLGTKVNTSGRENFPYISRDNVLFFSSDGLLGLGGLDIYAVDISDSGVIGVPVNLGSPINSSADDFYFSINAKGNKGFFSSNREGGKGGDDIYFFEEKPCEQYLKGRVYDKSNNKAISNARVIVFDAMYKESDTLRTDSLGLYESTVLSCEKKYRLKVEKDDYNTIEIITNIRRNAGVNTVDIGLEGIFKPLEVNEDLGKKLQLKPIYFDFDKYNIRPDAAFELSKIVEALKINERINIDIRSYTDSKGSSSYNMKLSQQRAKATMDWMILEGIDPSRLTYQGFGDTRLLNGCKKGVKCSEEENAINRRSEFIITQL